MLEYTHSSSLKLERYARHLWQPDSGLLGVELVPKLDSLLAVELPPAPEELLDALGPEISILRDGRKASFAFALRLGSNNDSGTTSDGHSCCVYNGGLV